MKKIFSILLLCTSVLNLSSTVLADNNNEELPEDSACSTGSLEMSSEQLSAFKNEIPMIVDVKPNQLFIERLNGESEGEISGGSRGIVADGDEIVTSINSSNNIQMTAANQSSSYPSKVDNSTERTFPIIQNQGDLNSCLGWSLAYYQLTNNANKIRGTYARSGSSNITANVYSPNWVYNLAGLGNNNGTFGKYAANVLYTYGCPTVKQVPILTSDSRPTNYLNWYPTSSIWESALNNKCDLYYGTVNPDKLDTPITNQQSPYLDNIKKLLADGYVVTIETYVNPNSGNYLPITKTGRTSDNNQAYVWTEVRNVNNGGHAVTIVGYDDNFRVDINRNGYYQEGEYGAFKIANSWGENVSKHDHGYVWLSYDALNKKSAVLSSNDSERVGAFRNGDMYYFIKPQKEYNPLLTAEIGINTRYRGNVNVRLGIEDVDNSRNYYEKNITYTEYTSWEGDKTMDSCVAFGLGGGDYNLSGTTGYSTGYVTFDFSSLLQKFELEQGHNYKIYIKLSDYSDNGTTTINSFSLKDCHSGKSFQLSGSPVSTSSSNKNITANVAYLSSISTAQKDKVFELTFNSQLNSETVTDENIFINKSNGDSLPNIITLNKTGEKIFVALETGIYNNGFYTLNILKGLKSKGGNGLSDNISVPFYVPFH